MIDRDLEIRTTDGDMTTFITHPEGDGPYPLILFLMDAPGKREELHDMARRLAAKGYYVMSPEYNKSDGVGVKWESSILLVGCSLKWQVVESRC